MTDWDGHERRVGMVTREEFSEFVRHSTTQRKELCDMVREIRLSVIETQRSLKCVHTTWEAHLVEYGDILKEAKNVSRSRAQLRMAIAEKSIVALVWAMLLVVGYALWNYIKSELR
jgi:hypothetical protein